MTLLTGDCLAVLGATAVARIYSCAVDTATVGLCQVLWQFDAVRMWSNI